jgi:hypothetical protein
VQYSVNRVRVTAVMTLSSRRRLLTLWVPASDGPIEECNEKKEQVQCESRSGGGCTKRKIKYSIIYFSIYYVVDHIYHN